MEVPDRNLQELREQGFTIVEGFLAPDELRAAQEALWLHYPRPEQYFADPPAHHEYARTQFDGIRRAPWQSWALNRLAFHPDLVDLAERFLGSADLHLYDALLWAKYAGAIDYEQVHHRDFVNHSLVVPDRDDPGRQMTSFVLLSDVDEEDGPTKVVPLEAGATRPYWPKGGDEHFAGGTGMEPGAFAESEVSVTGPAGTLFAYRTDVLHRGSQITGARRARFVLLAGYEVWGPRWTGKVGWPTDALGPHWTEVMERATPRERALFGFPAVGDPYWTEQTLTDVQCRYPGMDMTPYYGAAGVEVVTREAAVPHPDLPEVAEIGRPTLYLTVGLPGTGKTTAARRIEAEHGALRLTKDEWVKALYGHDNPAPASDVIEGRLIQVGIRALELGVDVVLDYGLWSRDERAALREAAAGIGAAVVIRYFELTPAEQRTRLDQRLAEAPHESWPMSEQELADWASRFEVPTPAELDGSEPVGDPPAGFATWRDWTDRRWPRAVAGVTGGT